METITFWTETTNLQNFTLNPNRGHVAPLLQPMRQCNCYSEIVWENILVEERPMFVCWLMQQSKGFLGLHQCIWLDKQKKPHSIFEKVLRDKQCNLFLIFQHFFVWKDSFEHLPGCRKLISIVIQPMDGLIHAFMLIFVHSLHLPSLSFRNQSSFLSSFLVWTKNSVNLFAYLLWILTSKQTILSNQISIKLLTVALGIVE